MRATFFVLVLTFTLCTEIKVFADDNAELSGTEASQLYDKLAANSEKEGVEKGHTSSTVKKDDQYRCERFSTMPAMYGEADNAAPNVRTVCTKL